MLPVGIAAIALVATGLVQGFWSDRWSIAEELQHAEEACGQIPTSAGDWNADGPITVKRQNDGTFYLVQSYTNRRNSETVSIALIGGRPGPVSIHTPDVCYSASGFDVTNRTTQSIETNAGKANFYTTEALKQNATRNTKLRIYWSWLTSESWQVSDNPRITFAGEPVLFKFYVIRELTSTTSLETDPCVDFIKHMLPAMQQVLSQKE